MGVQFGWYIPERVIFINFYNQVTRADYQHLHAGLIKMLEKDRSLPIHVIQDESNINTLLTDVGRVFQDSAIAQGRVTGGVATIGMNRSHPIMMFISTTLAKLGKTRYQRFHALEDAENYLADLDPTLDFSQAARRHLEMTILPNDN